MIMQITLSKKFKINRTFIFLEDAMDNVVFMWTPTSAGFSKIEKKYQNLFWVWGLSRKKSKQVAVQSNIYKGLRLQLYVLGGIFIN